MVGGAGTTQTHNQTGPYQKLLTMSTKPLARHLHFFSFYLFPLLVWMIWIYYLSDQPSLPHPARKLGVSDYLFDYAAHAFTFGVLAWLAWRAARRVHKLTTATAQNVAGLFASLYAASDEVHQMLVRGRKARLSDWLADVVGIVITLGLITLWRQADVGGVIAHLLSKLRARI